MVDTRVRSFAAEERLMFLENAISELRYALLASQQGMASIRREWAREREVLVDKIEDLQRRLARVDNGANNASTSELTTSDSAGEHVRKRSRTPSILDYFPMECTHGRISNIQQLTDEILLEVFSYLRLKDLLILSQANKFFLRLSQDRQLWKRLYLQHFAPVFTTSMVIKDWKELFRETVTFRFADSTRWDNNYKHHGIAVSNNGLTARHSAKKMGDCSVRCTRPWSAGIHYFEIIVTRSAGGRHMYFGLTTLRGSTERMWENSWFYASNGMVYGEVFQSGLEPYATGDNVGFLLDTINGHVMFCKNGKQQGKPITITIEGPVYAGVTLYDSDHSATINKKPLVMPCFPI